MKSVAVTEFKARCLSLLEDVARSGQPLVVTKRGKPLARVVPTSGAPVVYPQATLRGTVRIRGDLITPVIPLTAWNAVRGVRSPENEPWTQARGRRLQERWPLFVCASRFCPLR